MKKVFIYGTTDIYENYVRALNAVGAQAILSEDVGKAKECDALLLAGGGDVSPCLYGQSSVSCRAVSLKRDISELYLIASFLSRRAPVMGVCRGLQILNVFFEGTLNQYVPQKELHYDENGDVYHTITIAEKGFMYPLFGKTLTVNSAHRQTVKTLGKNLKACATSPDGQIEALFHKTQKVIGVQFHPERMTDRESNAREKIYSYFISLIG